MTATEIACLCIGAAGILTALLSLPFFCRGRALSKKCSARTTGTVQRYRIGGGNRKAISPVVAYLVDGKPYTAYLRCGKPPFRVRAGCSPHPHRRHVLQLRGTRRSALAHWQYHARGLQSPQSQAGLRGKAGQPWRYGRRDIALHRRGTGGFRRRNVFALSITERNLHDDLTIRTKYFQNIHGAQSSRQCVVLPQ